jgi:hypothetical protein
VRRALTRHGRPRPADKLAAPCWAPHILGSDLRRRAADIVSVHALVLDYDDGADVPDVMALFPERERCAYTTWSALPGAPKCRLVLPLAAPVAGGIWSAVMRLILQDIGQAHAAADPKCVDPSRLYLLPVQGPVEVADYAPGDLLDVAEYVDRAEYDAELARLAAEHARAKSAARAAAAVRWERGADDPAERRTRAGHRALRTDPAARRADASTSSSNGATPGPPLLSAMSIAARLALVRMALITWSAGVPGPSAPLSLRPLRPAWCSASSRWRRAAMARRLSRRSLSTRM